MSGRSFDAIQKIVGFDYLIFEMRMFSRMKWELLLKRKLNSTGLFVSGKTSEYFNCPWGQSSGSSVWELKNLLKIHMLCRVKNYVARVLEFRIIMIVLNSFKSKRSEFWAGLNCYYHLRFNGKKSRKSSLTKFRLN